MFFEKTSSTAFPFRHQKAITLGICLILAISLAVSGTLAFLFTHTEAIKNVFIPSHVTCAVTEVFDGINKTNVNVTNTGDTDAYIRVKLVSYRVSEISGNQIGGTAPIPNFTPGNGWAENDGFYYYTHIVAPGQQPAAALIDRIALEGHYSDTDGGKQVIEVMAEAIQADGGKADGTPAVTDAWSTDSYTVVVDTNKTLAIQGNNP